MFVPTGCDASGPARSPSTSPSFAPGGATPEQAGRLFVLAGAYRPVSRADAALSALTCSHPPTGQGYGAVPHRNDSVVATATRVGSGWQVRVVITQPGGHAKTSMTLR